MERRDVRAATRHVDDRTRRGDRPAERMAILRQAFEATLKDPAFLSDAKRLQMEIDPLTGPEIEKLLAAAYRAPKAVVAEAAKLVP